MLIVYCIDICSDMIWEVLCKNDDVVSSIKKTMSVVATILRKGRV